MRDHQPRRRQRRAPRSAQAVNLAQSDGTPPSCSAVEASTAASTSAIARSVDNSQLQRIDSGATAAAANSASRVNRSLGSTCNAMRGSGLQAHVQWFRHRAPPCDLAVLAVQHAAPTRVGCRFGGRISPEIAPPGAGHLHPPLGYPG